MNCPRCKAPMLNLGKVQYRTGDANRMVCPRCKVTCFEQAFKITAVAPLHETLARLARMAEATG